MRIRAICLAALSMVILLAASAALGGSAPDLDQPAPALTRTRMAFLDKLMEEGSKERKILQGAQTMLSGVREVDVQTERTIGETFALKGFERYGLPVDNEGLQDYVNLVGAAVARNSLRPTLPYRFVVVESQLKNAFSCPGGIIFLSSGLLGLIENEAQLASILAHEVAHVQHKHALKSIKRARFLQGAGKITAATMKGDQGEQFESMLGDLQTVLFDRGLDRNMEFEADISGMKTAYRTGYDPSGMIEILEALQQAQADSKHPGSWFSTHPPLSERLTRCRQTLTGLGDRQGLARLEQRYREQVR